MHLSIQPMDLSVLVGALDDPLVGHDASHDSVRLSRISMLHASKDLLTCVPLAPLDAFEVQLR